MNIKKVLAAIMVGLFALSMVAGGIQPALAAQTSGRETITVKLNFSQPQKTVKIAELPKGRYDFMITIQDINSQNTPGLETIRLVNLDRRFGENYERWYRPKEGSVYRESINIVRGSVNVGMEFESNPIRRWQGGGSEIYVKVLVEWRPR